LAGELPKGVTREGAICEVDEQPARTIVAHTQNTGSSALLVAFTTSSPYQDFVKKV
jgi:hypothetical protein